MALNLSFFLPWAIVFSFLRFLPFGKEPINKILILIYKWAVKVNNFYFKFSNIKLIYDLPAPSGKIIIIANHISAVDILVCQAIFTDYCPVRFLVKKEVLFVPIIGQICYAYDMPFLDRKGRKDKEKVRSLAKKIEKGQGSILLYPEGTRFSKKKKKDFENVLNPKVGGLSILLQESSSEDSVYDLTIQYPQRKNIFWKVLSGQLKEITIDIDHFKVGEINDVRTWLNNRWKIKESKIAERRVVT